VATIACCWHDDTIAMVAHDFYEMTGFKLTGNKTSCSEMRIFMVTVIHFIATCIKGNCF
jgi:hypothetical protein